VIRAFRIVVAAAVATAVSAPIGTAQADPLDMQCGGTLTVTWSPGLTLTPADQTVTTNEIDAPCVSASVPEITAGFTGVTIHATQSCLTTLEPGSGAKTFTWNTGQTSVFSFNRTVTIVGGNTVVTLTGAISQGLFAGDSAVEVLTGPALNTLQCLTPPGITSHTDVVALTIT